MQFLKIIIWVLVIVTLFLFSWANWRVVTIDLWGGLQADVNLPFLVLGSLLLGFLPTYIVQRARIWSLRRRYETGTNAVVANAPIVRAPPVPEGEPRANQ